jgi:hypothetical protein
LIVAVAPSSGVQGIGLDAVETQQRVALGPEHEPPRALHPAQGSSSSGSTSSSVAPRARRCSDLRRAEAEVDRHQHAPVPGDPEERGHQARRVVRHDRHALAEPDPELVEPGRLRPRERGQPGVRQLAERRRRLLGSSITPTRAP